ncbi:MAG: coenzyme F420-0:L-glutamate ligase [Nitrososphaerota archaeon]|jgi:coenzyme F420-0:L-glutamate ligase/coenzyme F420-1:gamma-L-glutamate ligase|nr:coenzyme F420-0:L-glutamate ligase [Nitrososphaerota archaeon]
MNPIQVIAIEGLPLSKKDDNIGQLIVHATKKQEVPLQERDIIVVTHVFVSKAEGNVVNLDTIVPSERAFEIAKQTNKEPALVEVILQEAKEIVRIGPNSIITETKSGTISANSGVDRSNVLGERNVVPLPKNPNRSAQDIRTEIKRLTGVNVAVIISDTHGRPFRMGEINVAIGVAGIKPIRDRRGEKDLFGYTLRVKQTAIADELASTAELVMGQASEGIPVAVIRGYTAYQNAENVVTTEFIRSKEKDLFR